MTCLYCEREYDPAESGALDPSQFCSEQCEKDEADLEMIEKAE